MAEETQNPTQLEQIGGSLTKIEQYIEKNKKPVMYVVLVVALLICGFFAYKNLYINSKQDEALASMFHAEAAFRADSFHIALYGNENVTGFIDIVDEYGRTEAGNTACYYAGCCCMSLGEFDNAVKYLKKFSTEDPILNCQSICLLGDAYCELEKYEDAVSYYEKAAKTADNEMLSPRCLMKAGLVYEKLGKYADAVDAYTRIQKNYNNSPEANTVEKYITRAQLQK